MLQAQYFKDNATYTTLCAYPYLTRHAMQQFQMSLSCKILGTVRKQSGKKPTSQLPNKTAMKIYGEKDTTKHKQPQKTNNKA